MKNLINVLRLLTVFLSIYILNAKHDFDFYTTFIYSTVLGTSVAVIILYHLAEYFNKDIEDMKKKLDSGKI